MQKKIKNICICGAGTMGSGIAQVAAQAGYQVIQYDVNEKTLENSRISINNSLQISIDKGKITNEKKHEVLNKIFFTSESEDCTADVIIEAIIENKEAKIDLLNMLSAINSDETILATNTSSISISSIAENIKKKANVVGMHFFNPAPVMKLIEIVRAKQTSEKVVQIAVQLAKNFGKIPVICNNAPGFIVNRVARPYYFEALKMLEDQKTDIEIIDVIMESIGFKMGPFRLIDLIGVDVNFSVSNIVWEALGRPERLKPSLIQHQKVELKKWGRKTGKGFYDYADKIKMIDK